MTVIIVEVTVLIDLFLTFAKIGMFTFGGGYAMIALIEKTCVEDKKWISHDEMMDVTVIAESTPGPIAINCATYVGYKKGKLIGAVVATLGMVLPSFMLIYIVAQFLDGFLEITWIANAFKGVKIAVGILIIDAALKMLKKMKKKPFQICIVASSAITMVLISIFSLEISSMILMLAAAIIGIIVMIIFKTDRQERNTE